MEDSMIDDNPSQPEADSFRGFESAFKAAATQLKEDAKLATVALRQGQVETLSQYKMSDSEWEGLLSAARKAAQHGEKQHLLLRFPSGLCTDDSRAINNPPNDTWPETLRGEAAEIYQRWHETLKSRGFELTASVLNFPGGQPGDVGLFLRWGEDRTPDSK
jgi:hypothetical protein